MPKSLFDRRGRWLLHNAAKGEGEYVGSALSYIGSMRRDLATSWGTVVFDAKWACIRICARGREQVWRQCHMPAGSERRIADGPKSLQSKGLPLVTRGPDADGGMASAI